MLLLNTSLDSAYHTIDAIDYVLGAAIIYYFLIINLDWFFIEVILTASFVTEINS